MSTENVQNTRAALKFRSPQIAWKYQFRNILLPTAPVSAIIARRIYGELEKSVYENYNTKAWRGVGVAYRAGFENQCARFGYRGFESRPLRLAW